MDEIALASVRQSEMITSDSFVSDNPAVKKAFSGQKGRKIWNFILNLSPAGQISAADLLTE